VLLVIGDHRIRQRLRHGRPAPAARVRARAKPGGVAEACEADLGTNGGA